MIEFFNIKPSSGGGDGSSLNIFAQLEEPSLKKGIWLKAEKEIEHIAYDEEVFIAGEWAQLGQYPNLPVNMTNGRAVNIGIDIYLFYQTKAYKYNTLTKEFTQLTNVPYSFSLGSIALVGTDIYIFGGSGNTDTAYKYNTLTDTYTQLTHIPVYFMYGSASSVGTDIYLFCGMNSGYGNEKTLYKYDTLTDTYTQLSDRPTESSHIFSCVIGTNIYFNGGSSNLYLYKYDTLENTYTQLTNMPFQDLYYSSAVSIGTDIYIFSGVNAKKYNTLNNTFTTLTNIPNSYQDMGSAVNVGDKIYLLHYLNPNGIMQVYALESKEYDSNTLVISQGKFNNVGYEIELFSNAKNQTPPKYAFADAWFYGTDLETDIPTYYGNGEQWINIKNPT